MPVSAEVEPSVLIWSRRTAGLTVPDAAHLLSVSEERLVSWEEGRASPTIGQVRKMSDKYKRPLNVFFLGQPPSHRDEPVPPDYRSAAEERPEQPSRELIFALRKMHNWRLDVLDLHRGLEIEIPEFEFELEAQVRPEEASIRIRRLLGVTEEEQFDWGRSNNVSGNLAFNSWREKVESVGVLVFQASRIETNEMRGVSSYQAPFPSILINSGDSIRARIFTLLHEFAHISLHSSGLCDPPTIRPRARRADPIEVTCNAFAGATLVPRSVLRAERLVRRAMSGEPLEDDDYGELASKYVVSRFVILRRLLDLGVVDEPMYTRKQEAWRVEPQPRVGGGGDGRRTNLTQRGRHYTRLVITAFRENRITRFDCARMLGVKPRDLPMAEDYARL